MFHQREIKNFEQEPTPKNAMALARSAAFAAVAILKENDPSPAPYKTINYLKVVTNAVLGTMPRDPGSIHVTVLSLLALNRALTKQAWGGPLTVEDQTSVNEGIDTAKALRGLKDMDAAPIRKSKLRQ